MLKKLLTFFSILAISITIFSSNAPFVHSENSNEWNPMNVPQAGTGSNSFEDMVAISQNDIWAVGTYTNQGHAETLTQHWDGTSWTTIKSPNTNGTDNRLRAVAARASNDVWAVGYHANSENNTYSSGTLMMHWDGSSWTITPGPYDSMSNSVEVNDVFIASQNDVWAVGTKNINALLLHWNGQEWTEHTIPGIVVDGSTWSPLHSIYGTSANDIWIVGSYNDKSLTAHWDGQGWSIVPSPSGKYSNRLTSVIGFAPNNYWALGSYIGDDNNNYLTVLHWDGNSWQTSPLPAISAWYLITYNIFGTGSNNLWVSADKGNSYNAQRAFAMHYDGESWQEVSLPPFANEYTTIRSIITPNVQTTYAAGWYVDGLVVKSTILQYGQPSITPTATQIPTPTPTAIPMPTLTPTPIPNIAVTFSNVALTNLTKDSATITWTTNTPSSSKAKYGTTLFFLTKLLPGESSLTTTHSITLSNLSSRKRYYIKLYGTNGAGKEYSSKTYSFRTL